MVSPVTASVTVPLMDCDCTEVKQKQEITKAKM
jgi:hypothetical protein